MDDSEAIRKQINGLVDAFNRADAEARVAFLTEDAVGMPPNQPPVVGKEAVRVWWMEGFRVAASRLGLSSQELNVLGDWAIGRYTWTMETRRAAGGAMATDNGKGFWVWRRQADGSWKNALSIWNSDNPVPGTLWSGAPRPTT